MILADFELPRPLRATMKKFVSVVCPPDVVELGIVDEVVDHFVMSMRTLPTYVRAAMVAGMTSFELAAAVLPSSRGKRFSQLDAARAEKYFVSWWRGPVGAMRQFAFAVKALVVMGYYEHPRVREKLAYRPDAWISERAKQRLAEFGLDIEDHERELVAPDPLIAPATLTRKVVHEQHEQKAS
jgi:hypothetical protein